MQFPNNCLAAKKASEEDADGFKPKILLAEGACVMITYNLWTSKSTRFVLSSNWFLTFV